MTTPLIETINKRDFPAFQEAWENSVSCLSITSKQELLTDIVVHEFTESEIEFFMKIFDLITVDLCLDFNIESFAPTFLSAVAENASIPLFDYFLEKGADINFIGDSYAFETQETINLEVVENEIERYYTCLDFAELNVDDMLAIESPDYENVIPEKISAEDIDKNGQILIDAYKYNRLVSNVNYLQDLLSANYMINYIKKRGGKTYQELKLNNSISIKFGTPECGWLHVIFHYKDFHIEFYASDVLNNPIEELYIAITELQNNQLYRITWWLEGDAYFFDFEKQENLFVLSIIETDDLHFSEKPSTQLIQISGNKEEIIEPFLVALKLFCAQTYKENDWSCNLDSSIIASL